MNDTYKIELGTFGDYLNEEWIEPLNLSAYRLSKDLGISAAALSKILKGKNRMSDDVCWRLARYFGTSPNFFIRIQAEFSRRNKAEEFRMNTKNLPVYKWK